jgi:glycosyltransferase involved in cell wall biosynthesis
VNRRSLSVLYDLRPAFEGFYGIAQETRLTFPLLQEFEDLEVTGLINHPARILARASSQDPSIDHNLTPALRIKALSRFVASTTPPVGLAGTLSDKAKTALNLTWLQLLTMLGARIPLDRFDGAEFGDFLWRTLFWRSLPPTEFERCRTARYATLWAPWSAMHATALVPWPRKYARIDTSGYDVLVAQTPWPGTVGPRTRLVVRYHDSMPVFLPHTVKQPRLHQFFHLSALQENAKSAAFACVSEHSRTKLLQLFPGLEKRAFVVHDHIADDYFPETATHETVTNIVTSRIDGASEPDLGSAHQHNSFYDTHVRQEDFRFLLVVSTLEPRKNHLGLLAAWEAARMKIKHRVALVFVGSSGWGNTSLLRAMRKWQSSGELFHLSAVPPSELRLLYAAADAVVCPSVSEGFDLPSVEALRCGGAVAASDIPVHREILGEAALYFDPYSTAGMCDALVRLLTVEEVRSDLRGKAGQQAAKYDKSGVRRQWQQVFDYCRANAAGAAQ